MPHPSEVSSMTPAWDLSSRTPEHHALLAPPSTSTSDLVLPAPTLNLIVPEHPLLNPLLFDVKVQVKVLGGQLNLAKVYVSSMMHEGRPRIIYTANRRSRVLEPGWVTVIHPNVKQTDALLVVLKGEYLGRFALRIRHTRCNDQETALVELIDRVDRAKPRHTGIDLHLPADHLGIVSDTKEEKQWHTELMADRRKQVRV